MHIMLLYIWNLRFTNYVINIYIKHTMLLYHNIYNNHIHKNTQYTYLYIPIHIHIYTYIHIHIHTHIYGEDIISTHEIISTVVTYIDFIMQKICFYCLFKFMKRYIKFKAHAL